MRRAPSSAALELLRPVVSLAVSASIHLLLASPLIVYALLFAEPDEESPGDEGTADGPIAFR